MLRFAFRHSCRRGLGASSAAKPASLAVSARAASSASTPPPPSVETGAKPAAPAAAAAPKNKAAGGSIHKLSSNTADASAYVSSSAHEVPSYSAAKHNAFLALHGRRLWLPLLMVAGYTTVLAPFLTTPVQQGVYWTACILLQRLSVHGKTNTATKDLTGHTCVVTGGTSGIGLYTCQQLLNCGAHVVIASKPGKEEATRSFLLETCSEQAASESATPPRPLAERITFLAVDYNDQLDIMAAAARVKALFNDRIDLLVNCAGVWKEEPGLTKQGFEEHIGVNFLGPFHFTEALLPSLRKAKNRSGRVVYVTCASHNGVKTTNIIQERMLLKPGPNEPQVTARCYSAAKLGNIYHAQSIANRRYEGIPLNKASDLHPVDVLIADPGFCSTNLTTRETGTPLFGDNIIGRTLRSLWIKNALEGSQTVVNCCLRDEFENGGYYHECTRMDSGLSKRAQDSVCREEVVRWAMAKTIARYYTTTSTVHKSAAEKQK